MGLQASLRREQSSTRTSLSDLMTTSWNVFPTSTMTGPFCSRGGFSERVNGVSKPAEREGGVG